MSTLLTVPIMVWTSYSSSTGEWYAHRIIIGIAVSPIAKPGHRLRKGVPEILVLPAAESVACHYDPGPEPEVLGVKPGEIVTLLVGKQALEHRTAGLVQRGRHGSAVDHDTASRARSARFRSSPQR